MSKRKPLAFPGQSASDVEKHYEKSTPSVLGGWDSHYVPGYSDKRRNNQLAQVDPSRKPVELPIDLLWARCIGERDRVNVAPQRRRGFEFLRARDEEDAKQKLAEWGYGFPEAGWVDDSGLIRKDDTVLMFRTEETRKAEAEDIKRQTDLAEGVSSKDNIEMVEEERRKIKLSDDQVTTES